MLFTLYEVLSTTTHLLAIEESDGEQFEVESWQNRQTDNPARQVAHDVTGSTHHLHQGTVPQLGRPQTTSTTNTCH